jgi:hypothetical protein
MANETVSEMERDPASAPDTYGRLTVRALASGLSSARSSSGRG